MQRTLSIIKPDAVKNGHTGAIRALAFTPDGKMFATGADDGTVKLWNPQTGKELRVLLITNLISAGRI